METAVLLLSLALVGVGDVPDCSSKTQAQQQAMSQFSSKVGEYNETNPPDDGFKPNACMGGKIRWEKTSWKMDIPEFSSKKTSWKMDVPVTTMKRQKWSFKKPVLVCENKKTGQYPEFKCHDTWISLPFGGKTKGVPACTTTWSDIITKVCWPEARDQEASLDVPEFAMRTQEFSMDVPQVRMQTKEMSLHLPQFYMDSGCVGEDCSKACQSEMDAHTAERNRNRDQFMADAKHGLVVATSDMYACSADALAAQKASALSEYDKYIAVAQTTFDAMQSQGLTEAAAAQEKQLAEMKAARKSVMDQMDKGLSDLQESQKDTLQKIGGA